MNHSGTMTVRQQAESLVVAYLASLGAVNPRHSAVKTITDNIMSVLVFEAFRMPIDADTFKAPAEIAPAGSR